MPYGQKIQNAAFSDGPVPLTNMHVRSSMSFHVTIAPFFLALPVPLPGWTPVLFSRVCVSVDCRMALTGQPHRWNEKEGAAGQPQPSVQEEWLSLGVQNER